MKRGTVTHHKTVDLARRLGIERWGAVGILESLWHATAERTPQGDIGKLSDDEISYYVGWSGDASTLVRALVDSRWLNECNTHRLLVHDWHDHADDATKKRLSRNGIEFLTGHVQSVTGNVQTCPDISATVPDMSGTLPDISACQSQSPARSRPEPEPIPATELIDSSLRSGLAGLDPLAALHRLGVNGTNAQKIISAGITTDDIRREAEAIVGDTTVKQPARALAARLMDRAGINRKRKGGNTTTADAETTKLVNAINRKRGVQ